MIKPQKYFAAIRKDEEGKEWIDLNTISGILECSRIKAQQIDKECGLQWVKANPVIQYAQVEIKVTKAQDCTIVDVFDLRTKRKLSNKAAIESAIQYLTATRKVKSP